MPYNQQITFAPSAPELAALRRLFGRYLYRKVALIFRNMVLVLLVAMGVSACTSGRLEYVTPEGERKFSCETEYTWQPSVDKYAVEYVLGYCASKAEELGNTVVNQELLGLDLSVPLPPEGKAWSHELAKKLHKQGLLTHKEYGYLIAYLDLGHDKQ